MIGQQALYFWLMSVVSITNVKFGTFNIEVLGDFLLILRTSLVLICTKETFAWKKPKETDFAGYALDQRCDVRDWFGD
jgi:hypothetical protein